MKHTRIPEGPVSTSQTSIFAGRLVGFRSVRDRFLAILLAVLAASSVVLSPSAGPGDRRASQCIASCIVQPCGIEGTVTAEIAGRQLSDISRLLVTVALQTAAFIEDYYPYDYFTEETEDLDEQGGNAGDLPDAQQDPFSEQADESDEVSNEHNGWYEDEETEAEADQDIESAAVAEAEAERALAEEYYFEKDDTEELREESFDEESLDGEDSTYPDDDSWRDEETEELREDLSDEEDSTYPDDAPWLDEELEEDVDENEAYTEEANREESYDEDMYDETDNEESDDESLGEEVYDNREQAFYADVAHDEEDRRESDWQEDYDRDIDELPSEDEWSRNADPDWSEDADRDFEYFDYQDEWNDSNDVLKDGERSQADQAEEGDPGELFLQHETSWSEEDDWSWDERAGAYDPDHEEAEDIEVEDPVWDAGIQSGLQSEATSEREVAQAAKRGSQNPSQRRHVPVALPDRGDVRGSSKRLTAVTSEQLIVTDRQLLEELERLSKASAWVRRIAMDDYLVSLGSEVMGFVTHFESATGEDVLDWSQNAASAAAFLASYRLYEQGLVEIDEAVALAQQTRHDLPRWPDLDRRNVAITATSPATPTPMTGTASTERNLDDPISLAHLAVDRTGVSIVAWSRALCKMGVPESLPGALAASLSGGRSAWLWWFWDRLTALSGCDWQVLCPGKPDVAEAAARLLEGSGRQR